MAEQKARRNAHQTIHSTFDLTEKQHSYLTDNDLLVGDEKLQADSQAVCDVGISRFLDDYFSHFINRNLTVIAPELKTCDNIYTLGAARPINGTTWACSNGPIHKIRTLAPRCDCQWLDCTHYEGKSTVFCYNTLSLLPDNMLGRMLDTTQSRSIYSIHYKFNGVLGSTFNKEITFQFRELGDVFLNYSDSNREYHPYYFRLLQPFFNTSTGPVRRTTIYSHKLFTIDKFERTNGLLMPVHAVQSLSDSSLYGHVDPGSLVNMERTTYHFTQEFSEIKIQHSYSFGPWFLFSTKSEHVILPKSLIESGRLWIANKPRNATTYATLTSVMKDKMNSIANVEKQNIQGFKYAVAFAFTVDINDELLVLERNVFGNDRVWWNPFTWVTDNPNLSTMEKLNDGLEHFKSHSGIKLLKVLLPALGSLALYFGYKYLRNKLLRPASVIDVPLASPPPPPLILEPKPIKFVFSSNPFGYLWYMAKRVFKNPNAYLLFLLVPPVEEYLKRKHPLFLAAIAAIDGRKSLHLILLHLILMRFSYRKAVIAHSIWNLASCFNVEAALLFGSPEEVAWVLQNASIPRQLLFVLIFIALIYKEHRPPPKQNRVVDIVPFYGGLSAPHRCAPVIEELKVVPMPLVIPSTTTALMPSRIDSSATFQPTNDPVYVDRYNTELVGVGFFGVLPSVYSSNSHNEAVSLTVRQLMPKLPFDPASLRRYRYFLHDTLLLRSEHVRPYSFKNWVNRFPPATRNKLIEARAEIDAGSRIRNTASAFVKVERMANVTYQGLEAKAPRNITSPHPTHNVVTGPWLYALSKVISKQWHVEWPICYASGLHAEDIGYWYYYHRRRIKPVGPEDVLRFGKGDQSKFDGRQIKELLQTRFVIYERFGATEQFLKYMKPRYVAKSKSGHYASCDGTQQSGHASTSVGNTLTEATLVAYILNKHGINQTAFAVIALGDDFVVMYYSNKVIDWRAEFLLFALDLKLELVDSINHIEFCSGLFWPIKGYYELVDGKTTNVVWGPKPGRVLPKIGYATNLPLNSRKQRMTHLRGVYLGIYKSVNHIPFLKQYFDCIERLTREVSRAAIVIEDPYKFKVRQAHEYDDESLVLMEQRYGLTQSHLKIFGTLLDTITELPTMVSCHDIITALNSADQ